MEKKMYQKPVMRVVNIRTVLMVPASDTMVKSVQSSELDYGGAGSGVARGRQGRVWADDEDWDD